MQFNINKKVITSKKGKRVYYSINNIEITGDTELNIKWDPFVFYTPKGNLEDLEGYLYFEVPALDETFSIGTLDKEIQIIIKLIENECNIYVIEKYVGTTEPEPINIDGLEGDIVLTGLIPADTTKEVTIEYKEVK